MNATSTQFMIESVRRAVAQRRQGLASATPPPEKPAPAAPAHLPRVVSESEAEFSLPRLPAASAAFEWPAAHPSDGPFVHLLETTRLVESAERKNDRSGRWGPCAFWGRGQAPVRERSLAATKALFAQIWRIGKELDQWFLQAEGLAEGLRGREMCDYAGLSHAEASLDNALRKSLEGHSATLPATLFRDDTRLLQVDAAATRHALTAVGELAREFERRCAGLAEALRSPLPSRALFRRSVSDELFGLLDRVDHGVAACRGKRVLLAGFRRSQTALNRQLLDAKKVLALEWSADLASLRPIFATTEQILSHARQRRSEGAWRDHFGQWGSRLAEAFGQQGRRVQALDAQLQAAHGRIGEISPEVRGLWEQALGRVDEVGNRVGQVRDYVDRVQGRVEQVVALGNSMGSELESVRLEIGAVQAQRSADTHAIQGLRQAVEEQGALTARLRAEFSAEVAAGVSEARARGRQELADSVGQTNAALERAREQASAELQTLKRELADQQSELSSRQGEISALRSEAEQITAELARITAELARIHEELARITALEGAVESLQNLPDETRVLFHRIGKFEASLATSKR